MLKKQFIFILLIGLMVSIVACHPREEDSDDSIQENSEETSSIEGGIQIPEGWTEPEIFRCRVSKDLMQGNKLDQAAHLLGRDFLESRIGTVETAMANIEKYGYCIEKYWKYTAKEIISSTSSNIQDKEVVENIQVQKDGKTWIVGYEADVSRWGSLPKDKGPARDDWNLGDWWILHQEDDIFSMMSYTDYQYIKESQKEYGENPFAAYPVSAEDIPEAEFWNYDGRPLWIDEVFYYEPLQTYLRNNTIVFEYEADTEEDSEGRVRKAALELERLYLEELCSKEYTTQKSGKFVSNLRQYYVKEYKDLELSTLENSLDRTVEKLAEQTEDPEGFKAYYSDIPSDCFMASQDGSLYNPILKAADNIWVASYRFLVKSNDPEWGRTHDENNQEYLIGEGFKLYTDAGFPHGQVALIVKQGKKYSMVMSPEIVKESDIRYE